MANANQHIFFIITIVSFAWISSGLTTNTLYQQCLCDVSSDCDKQCCCDTSCPSTTITYWNTYKLCANDGLPIPFCTTFYSKTPQVQDLYSGLRTIYTIIKRLFCIQKVNFVDPTTSFLSTSTDSQITSATSINKVSAINSNLINLTPLSQFAGLPQADSTKACATGNFIIDMNQVVDSSCRIKAPKSTVLTNKFLFFQNLPLNLSTSGIKVLNTSTASIYNATNASNVTSVCDFVTSNVCSNVVRQIKLFFVRSSSGSVSLDLTSSYIVLGSINFGTGTVGYFKLLYSYEFIGVNQAFASTSTIGYTMGSPIQFLYADTSSPTNYYKMFNPLNLALRTTTGACRTSATNDSDVSTIISFKFGFSFAYSCYGSQNLIITNLQAAFNYVASIGSSSNNINDFVAVSFQSVAQQQSVQLAFYYVAIGTQNSPQYKIIKAKAIGMESKASQPTLFVEYVRVDNSVALVTPSPPVINAYLPDNFLYPFSPA